MQKVIYMAGFIAVLVACNSSGEHPDNPVDSTNYSAHHGDTGTGGAGTDTAGMADKTMMSLMTDNMNQMKSIPSSTDPDHDFAALMKVHHAGALEMALMEVAQGADPQLKAMAQQMISEQEREIAELNTYLSGHKPAGGGDAFHKEVMGQMDNMKMDMDHMGSVDKQFVQMMIPHHQGAIDMAKAYLKTGAREARLKKMANTIITDQQKEINDLQAWLDKQ